MGWATLTLSNIAPQDFVRFDGKSGTPDLTNVQGLGVTFWVDSTLGLGTQYMEVDNFAVTPEPSVLLTLGVPFLIMSRAILRRRKTPRHQLHP